MANVHFVMLKTSIGVIAKERKESNLGQEEEEEELRRQLNAPASVIGPFFQVPPTSRAKVEDVRMFPIDVRIPPLSQVDVECKFNVPFCESEFNAGVMTSFSSHLKETLIITIH